MEEIPICQLCKDNKKVRTLELFSNRRISVKYWRVIATVYWCEKCGSVIKLYKPYTETYKLPNLPSIDKGIAFELKKNREVMILQNGNEVGRIFTPAGSGWNIKNAIQVCGFSEAFSYWGCGPYEGFKDIQLLFDGEKMEGKSNVRGGDLLKDCCRCYMTPCQCEVKVNLKEGDALIVGELKHKDPFIVKTWDYMKKSKRLEIVEENKEDGIHKPIGTKNLERNR